MKTYAEIFDNIVADVPQKLLSEALKNKLDEKGIQLSKRKIDLMASRLLNHESINQPNFLDRLKDKLGLADPEVLIEFTDEDTNAITAKMDKFVDEIPGLVQKLLDTAPTIALPTLKRRWKEEARQQAEERTRFKTNLYARWGSGLELLKMFITIAREVGSNINSNLRSEGSNPKTTDVLTRLHARACQISEEVVCLLENGFSDGAMARWRTLHEISTVAALIREHGEDLAERYIAHQAIESAKAAHQHQKYYRQLGQTPIEEEAMEELKVERERLTVLYGKDFRNNYGWAAKHLGISAPTLEQLGEAAKIDHLAPYYRMASHNVHANPKGIYSKLSQIGESEILLAGPSNAGMADPGHSTAISLMQITAAVGAINPTLDDLAGLKILEQLVNEIGESFLAAHERLEQDITQHGARTYLA
jgi:hypothetical protein